MQAHNPAFVFLLISGLLTAVLEAAPTTRPSNGEVLQLWQDRAPRATGDTPADIPTITPFFPDPKMTSGCAVIICPGGGYAHLSMEHEGTDVAKWLNDHGVAAFVLKYRIAPYGQPAPMLDGQRAVRTVRLHSKDWGLDWRRIGIMGFSAGGHVASTVGTHWDKYIPGSPDPVSGQSCRPDFMVLVYPVITMKEKLTHPGSRHNLLGDHPPQKLIDLYSNELQVTDETPPAFVVASRPDKVVPVKNSQLFVDALKYHKVPEEYLELPVGNHGFGLGQSDPQTAIWPDHCIAWMKKTGLIK